MTNYADEIDPYEYDFDNGFSGWTDEEIDAYTAYADECDRFDDTIPAWPGDVEIGEPPF